MSITTSTEVWGNSAANVGIVGVTLTAFVMAIYAAQQIPKNGDDGKCRPADQAALVTQSTTASSAVIYACDPVTGEDRVVVPLAGLGSWYIIVGEPMKNQPRHD